MGVTVFHLWFSIPYNERDRVPVFEGIFLAFWGFDFSKPYPWAIDLSAFRDDKINGLDARSAHIWGKILLLLEEEGR